jgi:transaldolase
MLNVTLLFSVAQTQAVFDAYIRGLSLRAESGADLNALPDKTLAALRDHGQPALRLEEGIAEAEAQLAELARLGADMDAVGNTLQDEGVKLFEAAYQKLLQQAG